MMVDERSSRRGITDALARYIEDRTSPGDLADLRRLGPTRAPGSAFWKVWMEVIEPRVPLPSDAEALADQETRWAVVIQALATLRGLRADDIRFGDGLAHAGFSELRLEQLLRSGELALFDQIRKAAAFLAAKGQRVDPAQMADLALATAPHHVEMARRNIARGFFRTLHSIESNPS